jgi:hypothetical protein
MRAIFFFQEEREGSFTMGASQSAGCIRDVDRQEVMMRELWDAAQVGCVRGVAKALSRLSCPSYVAAQYIVPPALKVAVWNDHAAILPMLWARSRTGSPFHEVGCKSTLMHMAARFGAVQCIQTLAQAGVSADVHTGYCERTPLASAAERGLTDAVAQLVQCKANVNLTRHGLPPALHVAADVPTATLLLHLKANVDSRDWRGRSPLDLAVHHQWPTVKLLLDAKGSYGVPLGSNA